MRITRLLAPFTLTLPLLAAAIQPVGATATPPINAECTWLEHGKRAVRQPCIVTGNSGGRLSSFRVVWADGVKTTVSCSIDSGCNNGTRKAWLFNNIEYSRMGFPRVIVLENLGVVTIDYRP